MGPGGRKRSKSPKGGGRGRKGGDDATVSKKAASSAAAAAKDVSVSPVAMKQVDEKKKTKNIAEEEEGKEEVTQRTDTTKKNMPSSTKEEKTASSSSETKNKRGSNKVDNNRNKKKMVQKVQEEEEEEQEEDINELSSEEDEDDAGEEDMDVIASGDEDGGDDDGVDDDDDDDDDADKNEEQVIKPSPPPTTTSLPDSNNNKKKKNKKTIISDGRYRNKQRCLTLCSRGVTARYRHLLEDLRTLLPHNKKDSKLDVGREGELSSAIDQVSEMHSCTTVLYLECRKRGRDAYLYLGNSPHGPSAKFHLSNVHTMDELRLTGNCMKGSRPVLSFDRSFDTLPELRLLKCLFMQVFGTPRGHPKSKPFVDRVMGFYHADGKIWVRNYQVLEEQATNAKEAAASKKQPGGGLNTNLVEIGPRFVLDPIRIFAGSFSGQTLYRNPAYVSPNDARSIQMKKRGRSYEDRKYAQEARKSRREDVVLPENPLDHVFD